MATTDSQAIASRTPGNSSQETLWEIDVFPREGYPNRIADQISSAAAEMQIKSDLKLRAAYGFLVQGNLSIDDIKDICKELLVDSVVQTCLIDHPGTPELSTTCSEYPNLVHVRPKAGVTDNEAESARRAIAELGFEVTAVQTFRKYWLQDLPQEQLDLIGQKILANDSIEQITFGPLKLTQIELGQPYEFQLNTVDLLSADDSELQNISRNWQLSLTLVEMQTIQEHYRKLERNPTDIELETLAQTWSEHCSHKTLAGRIRYTDENGTRQFDNMLKETIFAATQKIRADLGKDDWCVSVFEDNAGIVEFDETFNLAFKVETHNRPSAIEPYGGANTGIGGVIRDTLGTGLGAKPICSTDVFCFADPGTQADQLPPGVMHPRRIMQGVVAGVRDYGNRMGIPTVNGAVYFDQRYVGNPLVFCGNVGLIRRDRSHKQPQAGDLIVAIGGRTGRDGIHGATFSSAELTDASEKESGGAVQIGNAITEKMVMDVLLKASDENLFSAVTDCGAGGFSSAVGEMAEDIGAEVWLDKAPLKYAGLSYTEIWISEAQERMVCSVPPENWDRLNEICVSESVEATVIGKFLPTGRLSLNYLDQEVGNLDLEFMHDGRPPVVREATFSPRPIQESNEPKEKFDFAKTLHQILAAPNVASKHWIIRQYDHEVQAGSVIKPLVGINNDGPSDAAVVRPVFDSRRGVVISCGMNPHFGDFDPYHMAASAIDEAVRNCVAVGADPNRIAILDNFCWGYTDRPETLGALVRAALACYDVATVWKTPFISGKDSLNNEFTYSTNGSSKTISIPSTLLISAMGQVADVSTCVTMDLKSPGNRLYQIGTTRNEFGGSHFHLIHQLDGGTVPQVDLEMASSIFHALHHSIKSGWVQSCHDLSEGGLAVALAEMAFAGGLGVDVQIDAIDNECHTAKLFAESNSRFVCEVAPEHVEGFESQFKDLPLFAIGTVTDTTQFKIASQNKNLIESEIESLKQSWQQTLDWK